MLRVIGSRTIREQRILMISYDVLSKSAVPESLVTAAPVFPHVETPDYLFIYVFVYLFSQHFYFPASGQAVVTGVVPSPPPGSCLQLLSRIGFSNPTTRRLFIECC